jgi:hypothetical protein
MASTSRVRWSTALRKTSKIRRYHGGSARTQLAEFVQRLGPRPARTYQCPEARLLAPTPAEVKLRVFGFTDWLQVGRGQVLDSTIHRAGNAFNSSRLKFQQPTMEIGYFAQ